MSAAAAHVHFVKMAKILLWMTLVFPVLFGLTAATEETFGSVKEIAGELLELSRPETLDRQAESY